MAVKVKMVGDSLQIHRTEWGEDSEPRRHPRGVRLHWAGVDLGGSSITASKWRGKHNCRREKTA